MIIANIGDPKINLSKLIKHAEAGEDVVITRDGKPVVRLTPVFEPKLQQREGELPPWMGSMRGEITVQDDFDAADAELEQLFEAGR